MVRSRRLTVEKLDSRQLLAADSFGQVPSTVELRYEEQVIVGSSNEFGRLHDWNIVVDWYFPCSNQTDVNSDGSVSLDDVLAIVNHLNSGADYRVELGLSQNGDNSPLGALLDINHLNSRAGSAAPNTLTWCLDKKNSLAPKVDFARNDLASRLSVPEIQIRILKLERVEWRDTELEVSRMDQAAGAAISTVFRIILRSGDQLFEYRSSLRESPIFVGRLYHLS